MIFDLLYLDGLVETLEKKNNRLVIIRRMHSSRMRTVRCSGCLGGGGVCPRRGVCQTPLVDRMTDRCKNITLPQLRCER